MSEFAALPAEERALYWRTYAQRQGVPAFIVEKDFWVCWLLGRIFSTPSLGGNCVFKGGTSLSKVFGAINRFSEDIDLGLSPASLGWKESDLDEAPSTEQRRKRVKELEADCAKMAEKRFLPELEKAVAARLGKRSGGAWLSFEIDAATHSPVILFAYPQVVERGSYIAPIVKVELGSLTDQRPVGTHPIIPMIGELAKEAFDDLQAEVVALEIERTFWEKATILHAEYHRPAAQPMRDRYARHYSDFAALWRNPRGKEMASRLDLLERVRLHKSRFFGSAWASYDTARPGTLRLSPSQARLAELRRDYMAMEPMFLASPAPFEDMIETLRQAERMINNV